MWQDAWIRRDKTLLYLIPRDQFSRQEALAHQLPHANVVNWREEFLRTVRPSQRYLSLSVQGELDRLKQIGEIRKSILCFINNEYFLTRFNGPERAAFYRGLWSDFAHHQSIIVFTILDSVQLLPSGVELEQWEMSGRVKRPQQVTPLGVQQ